MTTRPRRPHTGTRGGHRRYRLTGPVLATGAATEAHSRDVVRERDRATKTEETT